MARYAEVTGPSPSRRKPGPVKKVSIEMLDDGTYTLCGYDEDHMEVKKFSAKSTDVAEKMMRMMGKEGK